MRTQTIKGSATAGTSADSAELQECPACDGTGVVGGAIFEGTCPLGAGAGRVTEAQADAYDPDDDFFGAEPTGSSVLDLIANGSTPREAFDVAGTVGLDLSEITFVDCGFAGAWFNEGVLTNTVFEGCDLSGADFAGATMTAVSIVDCKLNDEPNFTSADLSGATFVRVELSTAVVEGAANLEGIRLVDVVGLTAEREQTRVARGAGFYTLQETDSDGAEIRESDEMDTT